MPSPFIHRIIERAIRRAQNCQTNVIPTPPLVYMCLRPARMAQVSFVELILPSQASRPFADINRDLWTDLNLGIFKIFTQINETPFNDASYIQSALTPVASPMVVQMGYLNYPLPLSSHTVNYRYRKDVDLGDRIDLTVELRQSYINEGAPGLLIAAQVNVAITGSGWLANTFTLSTVQVALITNYKDLYIRFVANKV